MCHDTQKADVSNQSKFIPGESNSWVTKAPQSNVQGGEIN